MRLRHIPIEVKAADNLMDYLTLNALIALQCYYELYDDDGMVDNMAHWSFIGIHLN